MIDDKKIEAAANKHIDTEYARYNSGEVEEEMICLRGKDSFKEGAKWAINEFLKDLWHPASEEPKSNSNILIKIKAYKLVLYPEGKKEDICGYFYKVIEYDKKDKWKLTELEKEYQCNLKVIEWLYIDGLLPKEGGEQ